jgi:two-component system, OmpR family, sensor histidine kinase KdpD
VFQFWRRDHKQRRFAAEQNDLLPGEQMLLLETERLASVHAVEREIDELLAGVSHEMRSPLMAILTSIGVVLANQPPGLPESVYRLLLNANLAAERLAEVLDNLLELARLRAGRLQVHLDWCDVCDLVQRAAATIEPLARLRQQRLELGVPAEPTLAHVDAHCLERALLNVLHNAVRHGRHGGAIVLRLERHPDKLTFAVADDGPGISAADQERIFSQPNSITIGRSSPQPGGLGIPIARAMVEVQGGHMWVDSSPGAGTTIGITLPTPPGSDRWLTSAISTDMMPGA